MRRLVEEQNGTVQRERVEQFLTTEQQRRVLRCIRWLPAALEFCEGLESIRSASGVVQPNASAAALIRIADRAPIDQRTEIEVFFTQRRGAAEKAVELLRASASPREIRPRTNLRRTTLSEASYLIG
jgi:hypothetical protein